MNTISNMHVHIKDILLVSKLNSERIDCCPHCGETLLITHPTGCSRNPKNKDIFNNGGMIGGVLNALTDEQKTPNAFLCFSNVGTCFSCGELYFSIEFNAIDYHDESGEQIEKTDAGIYLLRNIEFDEPENYIVSQSLYADIPQEWVMSVFNTPYGNMYHHALGLIDIERFGEGADILLKIFDGLKSIKTEKG